MVKQSTRCAIYSRFSSEKQNPLSIDQQVRKCCEYADRHGLTVLEEHLYADEAISGATDDRAGLQRLLSAVQRKPKPFDAILCDDTSRVSRKLIDSLRIFEQLQFAGVRMIFVAQGIDSNSEQAELLVGVHGIVDSLYLRDLAKRTFRGVEQLALNGLHTGGRVFGYRRVPIESKTERDSHGRPLIRGVKLAVDHRQAAIVRRIFEEYARGSSMKRIAIDLNDQKIPSPQPQKGRISRSWCPSSIRHILRNERYHGVVVWGRHKKVRSPLTGKRIYKWRPESEWRRTEIPEQKIVSDQLWRAVGERMKLFNRLYAVDGRIRGGRAAASPYLFTGLLKCALCEGSVTIVSGAWKSREDSRYGCSMHAYRGDAVCKNGLLVARTDLEHQLLAGLQDRVLHPQVADYVLKRLEEQARRAISNPKEQNEELRRREAKLESEITNLTRALADGYSAALTASVAETEKELADIRKRLTAADSKDRILSGEVSQVRKFVLNRLTDLRGLLHREPSLARAAIAQHVQKITLLPNGRIYVASGTWNLLGFGSGCYDGARGQNRTGYARLFRAALYQ